VLCLEVANNSHKRAQFRQGAKLPVCEGTAGLAGAGGKGRNAEWREGGADSIRAGNRGQMVFIEGCMRREAEEIHFLDGLIRGPLVKGNVDISP